MICISIASGVKLIVMRKKSGHTFVNDLLTGPLKSPVNSLKCLPDVYFNGNTASYLFGFNMSLYNMSFKNLSFLRIRRNIHL